MSSGEKNRNNYEEFPEARKEKRRNKYYDDFIDDGEHPRPRRDRGIAPSGKTQLLMQEYISEEDQTIINIVLHGRIDLLQAEAVMELIQSKSELERKAAVKGLEGYLAGLIIKFQYR